MEGFGPVQRYTVRAQRWLNVPIGTVFENLVPAPAESAILRDSHEDRRRCESAQRRRIDRAMSLSSPQKVSTTQATSADKLPPIGQLHRGSG